MCVCRLADLKFMNTHVVVYPSTTSVAIAGIAGAEHIQAQTLTFSSVTSSELAFNATVGPGPVTPSSVTITVKGACFLLLLGCGFKFVFADCTDGCVQCASLTTCALNGCKAGTYYNGGNCLGGLCCFVLVSCSCSISSLFCSLYAWFLL